VNAFIDERRLLEVKRLLLFTMRSVEGVAHEIGFRDPAYFSRFFHGRASMPLGEWRNEQRKQSA
jgi:AraC family transcriptional regulator, transcriptional activator of pobA